MSDRALEIGARIAQGPSSRLIACAFQAELDAQLPLFDALSRVDLAHTLVLADNGIIPSKEARALLEALHRLRQIPDSFRPDAASGDLYTNREAWLMQATQAAVWLGAGRARREAITTAYAIKLREGLLALTEALVELARTLVDRSDDYAGALMPDYTYLQQAQPTSFGHYLLGFAYPVLRDLERIRGLYSRVNRSPAGCGSSNGSRLPQSRERLAELLGFDGLVVHARDAMWQADLQIEIVALLNAASVNMDRLAEDLQIFASDEFGLVDLDDSHARASKIMPQKKNPFALTYIRGLANAMTGVLTATAAMGRTPSGQPDNRLTLYGMVPKALDDTRNAAALTGEVVALLRFDRVRARAKLDRGFLLATELAEALVLDGGVSFRDAHRLVGNLVRTYLADGDFTRLTAESLTACAESVLGRPIVLDDNVLKQALDPE
ncbi:MAG: lyase family protein, partial [Gammaproteobacteria bacterium]